MTDTVTGLIWLKDAACLESRSYSDANQAAAGLAAGDCGLTDGSSAGDWRLPTETEWQATIAQAVFLNCLGSPGGAPSLTDDAGSACLSAGQTSFTGVQSGFYWSANTYDFQPTTAWDADLLYGIVSNSGPDGPDDLAVKTRAFLVWPVRGGR